MIPHQNRPPRRYCRSCLVRLFDSLQPLPKMAAPTTALRNLSYLCEAVYYDDYVGPAKKTPKPIKYFDDKKTSTQAAIYRFASPSPVTKDPKTLIIAVRGTSDKTDVKVDLDHEIAKAWDGADVDAHKGFLESAKLIYDAFEEFVPPGTPEIWITGHSLGGAVAHVYARHLLAAPEHPNLKVTLVTFGSPETFSESEETTENLKKHTDRLYADLGFDSDRAHAPPRACSSARHFASDSCCELHQAVSSFDLVRVAC